MKALIDNKYGKITTSIDYDSTGGLHDHGIEGDVYKQTGEMISGSTLERLAGLTRDQRKANMQTVGTVARYLDFSSAGALLEYINRQVITRKHIGNRFSISDMLKEHLLVIRFGENKLIELRHLAENRFEVVRSENSRLQLKSIMELRELECGYQFLAVIMRRNTKSQGNTPDWYSSGLKNKVREISFIKPS